MNNNVLAVENGILIKKAQNFDPFMVFNCGQCFRWSVSSDGSFCGVAKGKVLSVSKIGEDILIKGTDLEDYKENWHNYFDMSRDYSEIINCLSKDSVLEKAVKFGHGIRILKQEFFECVISFIISANNNIPRIEGIIKRLCENFGQKINEGYYSFPSACDMKYVTVEMLAPIKLGYRAKYIVNTINAFIRGEIDEKYILSLPTELARKELCKISGVGPKVADCILLFSLGRFDAFPTDVWVKRVMSELYMCSEGDAAALGCSLYGDYAGIAQQYLFFWRRSMDLKDKSIV